ncbi:transglycosylase SLT domain-containing protein [Rhodoferax sp.]|uniref:lytic transglycosylase domain-containing protein n=1 Tax=Rhodoferax sp. TaxID=50421 RepID=UPI00284D9D07|nr:transglycosylase SLT domain-containing protein [Rhodoferax sp.]MDR3371418.1 transglycosylase SLT domain-containing protein [Rhodoferax sp.]
MQFKTILTLIGLTGALAAPLASAQTAADDVLLQMQQAYRRGDAERLATLLPLAQGSRLEPWAAYWALSARLETATPDEISAFLHHYAGTYQEDRLRNDWLLLLGKRRDWTQYATVAQDFRMNDDREVRCYTLAMENIVAKVNMADEVKSQWYAEKAAGDGCTLAAQSHFSAGQLTEADIWTKARLTVEARQLDATRQVVAMVAPDASALLTEALKKPEQFLLKRPPSSHRLAQELAVLALIRWADGNPDGAAQALDERWSSKLSSAQRAWAWGAIGKQAAQKLSDNALGYFQKASPSAMTDDQLAWRVRAALRQSQWTDVLNAIQAMSPDVANDSTWVYWHARALMQPGRSDADRAQARQLLQDMASVRGFYPLLAEEELGQQITPPPAPAPLTAEEKQRALANPGLQRALAAIDLGLRSEGVREWNYSTNMHIPGGMNDRELLAAADLACQHAVWDRCINTSERTRSFIDMAQRFPMPYRQAVVEHSSEIGLDPAYVYGLIRQESRFVTDAHSGVGASGLMQLMPATARWTAKKIGLTDYKAHQLSDQDTNITLGTGYLKLILDDFAGSMPMAAAAYNAGPRRPRSWRGGAGSPVLEAAIWAENIPFNETRDYVKKVLANTTLYAAMITGQTQSLKARLGLIGPREAAAPDNSELP